METEVLRDNRDLLTGSEFDKGFGLVVHLDVRRRKWRKVLGLPRGARVQWEDVRTTDIQELSSFPMSIRYRVTFGDGYWRDGEGQRHYFGVGDHLEGIDLKRGVTVVTLRAAVFLAVLACVGLRPVSWLLSELFHVEVSKSSLHRWIHECASKLPDAEGIVRQLNADKSIREAHFDEIFPRGWRKGCVLVIKDEHGRIVAAQEIEKRTKENVVAFLKKLKSWGLDFEAFYIDGCKAYRQAIPSVFPNAAIQYDYFHIIQNIWRHLWRALVKHRKSIKRQAEGETDAEEVRRLTELAKRLWKRRGLIFKSEHRMSEDERTDLRDLMAVEPYVGVLRRFMDKVWGIFRDSKGELGARQRLGKLRRRPEVQPDTAFAKATEFLVDRFDDMITFLRDPLVQRNSLAESGIRCLRRLEQGHDGFRGPSGRDAYLRLYQAIRYCGWSVHRGDGLLILPTPLPADQVAA